MCRVYTHRIDYAVHSDSSGEALQSFNRILFVEIDDLRALFLGHFEARLDCVYREDSPGVQQLGARNDELTHWAAPKYCNGAAGMNARDLSCHPAGGCDV